MCLVVVVTTSSNSTRMNVCQSTPCKLAQPASIGVGFFGLEEDDLRLQTQQPGTQCLLVIGQGATPLAFGLQFLLQRSDPSHQIAFVLTLQRIVGSMRSSSTRASTSLL